MTDRVRRNTKAFITGCIIGGACLWVTLVLPGCSTVSGLAKDLGAASEGLRQAMTQDE
jgi:hypothetical protein